MPRATGPKFCQGNINTIQSYVLQIIELFSVSRGELFPSSADADSALSTRLWWGELMKKYTAMASGQQCLWWVSSWLTASPFYDLYTSNCKGTCRGVTTCPRRSTELFQARGVLDANRHNDTIWCLKFNSWNTVQTFLRDAFQTWLSFDKESVLLAAIHLFRWHSKVTLFCNYHGTSIYL